MRTLVYPILEGKIVERSVKKSDMAAKMPITERALRLKLAGKTGFKWDEVLVVHEFFPDVDIFELMKKAF